MTLSHVSNLLLPLTNAIAFQSWEDAEDLAREISRLSRLKRLQEVQAVQEAVNSQLNAKTPPEGSQVANPPIPFTLETRFNETGHEETWRNKAATELNLLLMVAKAYNGPCFNLAAVSIAARVAEFEQIQVLAK